MASKPRKVQSGEHFSLDLITQALHQLEFLAVIDKNPSLQNPAILIRVLYRYEKFWLPLAAAHPYECLSAPIDIEWLWHCHMLSPKAYVRDCLNVVGKKINHTLRKAKDYEKALRTSEVLWSRLYPTEPFHFDYTQSHGLRFESIIHYNIIDAAVRQKSFYYQVSLPHYRDKKFLEWGLVRYKKFIYLHQQLPNEFLVPCYDIDLFWHAHQVNPFAYEQDMMKCIGDLFDHDDSTNDRRVGSKLFNSTKRMRELWQVHFNEAFSLFGAVYRGSPPDGIYRMTQGDAIFVSTEKANTTKNAFVHVEELTIQFASDRQSPQGLELTVHGISGLSRPWKLTKFKKPDSDLGSSSNVIWNKNELPDFTLSPQFFQAVRFSLKAGPGFPSCSGKQTIGQQTSNFVQAVGKADALGESPVTLKVPLSSDARLHMAGHVTTRQRGPAVFRLNQGKFQQQFIPSRDLKSFFGPVALETLPPEKDNSCLVANHR